MSITDELIATLDEKRALFLEALKKVPDDMLTRQNVIGTWSIKNIIAHLTDQELLVAQILPKRLATGVKPAIIAAIDADVDAWNAKYIQASELRTFSKQLEQLALARRGLIQVIRSVGDEAIKRSQPWPEWRGTTAEYILQIVNDHEQEHLEAIRAALEKD